MLAGGFEMDFWNHSIAGHLDQTVAAPEEALRPRSLQSKVHQIVDLSFGFAMASSCSSLVLRLFNSSRSLMVSTCWTVASFC